MNRSQKEEQVLRMREVISVASTVIVTHQVGLTVSEVTALRRQMRQAGAEFKVMKNSLAQLVVKGTQMEGITSYLSGPTALAFSSDPVAAAKVISKFSTGNEKLKIVAGYLDGRILSHSDVKALASLPSLDELRSKMIAVISAPATKLAILAKEPATRVARVLAARGRGE